LFIAGTLAQNRAQPQNQKNCDDSKNKNVYEGQIIPLCPSLHPNVTNIIVTMFNDV